MKPDEILRCIDCGIPARAIKVGRSLILLGHIKTPKGVIHPVRLAPASRSTQRRDATGRREVRRSSRAAAGSTGTPERSDSVRAPVEAGSLSRDRTSIPSGRDSSPAGRARAAEVIPPALVAPRAPRSAGRS